MQMASIYNNKNKLIVLSIHSVDQQIDLTLVDRALQPEHRGNMFWIPLNPDQKFFWGLISNCLNCDGHIFIKQGSYFFKLFKFHDFPLLFPWP